VNAPMNCMTFFKINQMILFKKTLTSDDEDRTKLQVKMPDEIRFKFPKSRIRSLT